MGRLLSQEDTASNLSSDTYLVFHLPELQLFYFYNGINKIVFDQLIPAEPKEWRHGGISWWSRDTEISDNGSSRRPHGQLGPWYSQLCPRNGLKQKRRV